MHWADFRPFEKVLIFVLGLWYTLGWFVAFRLPEPHLFMAIPVLLIGATLGILSATSWVLRRLGH